MSYQFYKLLHIFGLLLVFSSLGAVVMFSASPTEEGPTRALRKLAVIGHGIGLVIMFVAGFGLMARLQITQGGVWPAWVYIKVALWLVIGVATLPLKKSPALAKPFLLVIPLVGALAAFVAIYKPFA